VEPRPPRCGVQDMWLKYLISSWLATGREEEGPGLLPPALLDIIGPARGYAFVRGPFKDYRR
jgi:hypothetical protein